jgi:hypothetical protein
MQLSKLTKDILRPVHFTVYLFYLRRKEEGEEEK